MMPDRYSGRCFRPQNRNAHRLARADWPEAALTAFLVADRGGACNAAGRPLVGRKTGGWPKNRWLATFGHNKNGLKSNRFSGGNKVLIYPWPATAGPAGRSLAKANARASGPKMLLIGRNQRTDPLQAKAQTSKGPAACF